MPIINLPRHTWLTLGDEECFRRANQLERGDLQPKFIHKAESCGLEVTDTHSSGRFVDAVISDWGSNTYYVELKSEEGTLDNPQVEIRNALLQGGNNYLLIRPLHKWEEWLDSLKTQTTENLTRQYRVFKLAESVNDDTYLKQQEVTLMRSRSTYVIKVGGMRFYVCVDPSRLQEARRECTPHHIYKLYTDDDIKKVSLQILVRVIRKFANKRF